MNISLSSWAAIGPELVLLVAAMILMLLGAYQVERRWGLVVTFLSLLVAGLLINPARQQYFPYKGAISYLHNDYFTSFFFALFLLIVAVVSLLAVRYLEMHESLHCEFFAMLLFTTIGMMIMAASRDLLVMFLGLETMSIAAYVLAGYLSPLRRSLEAGIKYFLTGALGSAIFLFGMAYLYGATGSLEFDQIGALAVTHGRTVPFFAIGITLLIAGFAFKIAVVPFHMWAPDVYDGAPTPVTAFMAVGIKAAAFSIFTRLILTTLDVGPSYWFDFMLGGLCAGTMLWGNIAAAAQRSVKRLLAYSSIAHAGYLLLAITARTEWTGPSILFYLFAYALMTLGAFAVLIAFENLEGKQLDIEAYAGLASRYPVLSLCLTIFLISLAGIPPTIGFMGKWYIFSGAIMKGGPLLITLAVIGVMASLVSVYYYMRVVYFMYMLPPHDNTADIDSPRPAEQRVATILSITVILFGCIPPLHIVQGGVIKPTVARKAAHYKKTHTPPPIRREVGSSDHHPAVRPETRPEARPTVRPEVRPEARPTVRPEARPTVRPAVRPEVRPTVRPVVRPVPTPRPVVRPAPAVRPAPVIRPAPATRPAVRVIPTPPRPAPVVRPTSTRVAPPVAPRPAPASQPTSRPAPAR